MDLKEQIKKIIDETAKEAYEKRGIDIYTYPWVNESDIRTQLVFFILDQLNDTKRQKRTQSAAITLQNVGLLDFNKLANIKTPNDVDAIVLNYTLIRHGFSQNEASRAIYALSYIAKNIQNKFNGRLQNLLVQMATNLQNQLVDPNYNPAESVSLTKKQLSTALSLWLQYIFNVPAPSEDLTVKTFCQNQRISPLELVKVANELDLNLGFIEHVLRLKQTLA